MTQNRKSGTEAGQYGHMAATMIGKKLGAKKLSLTSNEFELNGKRVTIRTARLGNNQFGVTCKMLSRVENVIAAFETAPNQYELRSITSLAFREAMRDSPTGKGRIGLVQKKVFLERGNFVAHLNISI